MQELKEEKLTELSVKSSDETNYRWMISENNARHERTVKRLIIALIILTVLMFASNAFWLYSWMQYDYEGTETETVVKLKSDMGDANYIGNDGDIYNGYNNSDKESQEADED